MTSDRDDGRRGVRRDDVVEILLDRLVGAFRTVVVHLDLCGRRVVPCRGWAETGAGARIRRLHGPGEDSGRGPLCDGSRVLAIASTRATIASTSYVLPTDPARNRGGTEGVNRNGRPQAFTDAGYIAIGLGVMGFQQAQVRGRELQERVQSTGDCVADRARTLQDRVASRGRKIDTRAREARDRAEGTVTQTVSRVQGIATELTTRVEPVVVQVQATVAELPERVASGDRAHGRPRARALHERSLSVIARSRRVRVTRRTAVPPGAAVRASGSLARAAVAAPPRAGLRCVRTSHGSLATAVAAPPERGFAASAIASLTPCS